MEFRQFPEWGKVIRNHYWYLRNARLFQTARIRKEYRRIAAEKKRLHAEGVDMELLRLLCRHYINPRNELAAARFWKRYDEIADKIPKKFL